MDTITVACMQPRLSILGSRDEFDTLLRRFLRQAQAKQAQLAVFPELTGLFLAPSLISRFKLGMIRRADQGRQPGAGFLTRRLGHLADATAGIVGGGLAGSLARLLAKNSDALRDSYLEAFGTLAREYGIAIVGGSLYLLDPETNTVRNRAFLFDPAGQPVGYQDKLNLAPEETGWAVPGSDLAALDVGFGRLGILVGQDALYPELARLLAVQGVDLIAAIAAVSGPAEAGLIRSAVTVRAAENQLFAALSFLLGPNHLDEREDYCGQSALLAPIALTPKGDGVLAQAGSTRAESVVTAPLPADALEDDRRNGRFRPRSAANLGSLGPVLAEIYSRGLSVDQAVAERLAGPPEVEPKPLPEPGTAEGDDATGEPPAPAAPALPEFPSPTQEEPPDEAPAPVDEPGAGSDA